MGLLPSCARCATKPCCSCSGFKGDPVAAVVRDRRSREAPPSPNSLALEDGEDVVGHRFDFAPIKAGRMRIGRHILAEFGGAEAAAPVLVRVFVEVRHLGGGPSAGDHVYQLLAREKSLV